MEKMEFLLVKQTVDMWCEECHTESVDRLYLMTLMQT